MEEWREIRGFLKYSVSNHGNVRREPSQRPLQVYQNQCDVVCVGLMRGHKQYKRSLPLLVARAFLPRPITSDTPINKDGNRWNNHVENLIWRPRWFAIQYNKQFLHPYDNPISVPIRDTKANVKYIDSFACAVANGLLEKDIVLSILNATYTWPTYQIFEVIDY